MAQTAQININVNASQAEKTVGDLNSELQQTTKSFNSMKAELRTITQELQGLEPGSKRFQELSQRAGQLRDTIADTNAVINATAGNITENFGRALGSSIQLGVAGFQALSSVQVLFGSENEELNKSLAQMGALLNLSQAIETFGGLGDKLTQIKAGFTPVLQQLGLMATTQTEVAVATSAADVALVGEAVAADGAAVSTGFFGAALNALPFVAIISALGLLVAGLISYSSSSGDAEKQEKKRVATLKAQREEEKKATETIAKESAEYVGLIYQLKATNAGSTERKTLIKEINATYGTTLKNLSDEKAFQQQLNLEVANYIVYQKAKFQLQKNEELVQKNLEKQSTLQKELTKAEALYNAEFNKKLGQDDLYAGQRAQNLIDYQKQISKIKGEIDAANKRLEAYGKVNLDVNTVIKDVTDNGKKYTDQTKDNTNATDDNTDALEKQKQALEDIKSLYDRQSTAERELEALLQARNETMVSGSSIIEDENGKIINSYTNLLTFNEAYFKKAFELRDEYAEKERTLIENATQREVENLDQQFIKKEITEKEYNKKRKEIVANGSKNLLDVEKQLLEELLKNNDRDLKQYERLWANKEAVAAQSTFQTYSEIEKLIFDFNQQMLISEVENSTKTEEEKNAAILKIKQDGLEEQKKLIQNIGDEQTRVIKLQQEKELDNFDLTENEKLQINAKYNKQLLEVEQSTQTAIQEAIGETTAVQETELEGLQKQLDTIDEYLAAVQQLFSQFESALTNATEQGAQNRLGFLEDEYTKRQELLQANLTQGIITEEEYAYQSQQIREQQANDERAIAKKSFQTNKALNIVGATMDGARAVLSTFANTPGELIIKSIAAALAGVFAATQIAVISKSTFQAATGGIVPGMGSGDVDSVSARLAPGEAVINSRSTSRFLPVLSAMNMAEGGRSLMPNLPATNQGQKFEVVFPKNEQMQPVRAYVVESDISDAQRRVQRIENSTRF